jgi:hypothetical protein
MLYGKTDGMKIGPRRYPFQRKFTSVSCEEW